MASRRLRRLHRRLQRTATHLELEQPGEDLAHLLVQTFALGLQPVLERAGLDAQPLEQRSLVERGRGLQGLRGALAREPLEAGDVDRHGGGVQPDLLALDDEATIVSRRERPAHAQHGLPQALAGPRAGGVAP